MPNRTQYIRNEDVEAWDALPNKSEWIHNHLEQERQTVGEKLQPAAKVPANFVGVDPILVPPVAKNISVHSDGTISSKDPTKPSAVKVDDWEGPIPKKPGKPCK